MSTPVLPTGPTSRRVLVAIGMVGGPLCLAIGNLIGPAIAGSPTQQLQAVHGAPGLYLTASVLQAAGFAQLGALGVGIAMLVRRRGSLLATIAALLTLFGGLIMGGAVLTSALVEAALPVTDGAALAALQTNASLGALFAAPLLAALGGVLGVIALLIARPVRIWVPILLLIGLVLANFTGGAVSALLSIPTLVAVAALGGALVRTSPALARERLRQESVLA